MSETRYVHALALGIDPAWRRTPSAERRAGAAELVEVAEAAPDVTTHLYSSVGLEPGVDILVWRLAETLGALEEAAAAVLRTGLGRWCTVRESLLGVIQPSQYVRRPTTQEQSMFEGERSRHIAVYPFTKSAEWYSLGKESRQGYMNEHMRIGHDYPQVRQLLANSFGLDDMDFLVAYEMDDPAVFSDLVRALRATDGRRSTVRDTPLLLGIHRPPAEIVELLAG